MPDVPRAGSQHNSEAMKTKPPGRAAVEAYGSVRLDARGQQQRWTEGNGGCDEGGDERPGDGPTQERAGRTEAGISASTGGVIWFCRERLFSIRQLALTGGAPEQACSHTIFLSVFRLH